MKVYYFIFLLLLLSIKTKAQTYTIPWATQQPAWVFPFWLEDGAGNKDTIYYCYDPNGHYSTYDYIFGEGLRYVDKLSFFSGFSGLLHNDSVYKAVIWDSASMYFQNGSVPIAWSNASPPYVKISWDVRLFRNTILPFPTKAPAPKIQGSMWWSQGIPSVYPEPDGVHTFCPYDFPLPISDTTKFPSLNCFSKDSLIFPIGCKPTSFYILPWTGFYEELNIKNIDKETIKIFPNPVNEFIQIESKYLQLKNYFVTFYSISGKVILSTKNSLIINLSALESGMYYIEIKNAQFNYIQKLIKL